MNKSELLSIAKPILFNTPMVQATLKDRKTKTRRIVKERALSKFNFDSTGKLLGSFDGCDMYPSTNDAPYHIGDILYVRETWHKYTKRIGKGASCRLEQFYGYKASIANSEDSQEKWRPSIHMPKEAARIFLRVTDVGIERLQDIRHCDIEKEGIISEPVGSPERINPFFVFKKLWDSTIKKSDIDRYGWNANPWVWVIEFERLELMEE